MGLSKNPLISGVATHKDLGGRMDADSHPISAVSGLDTALSDRLSKDNTAPFTPTNDYQPATKKYVDAKMTTVVSSFKGRTGAVSPEAGDYTPELVGAAASVHSHDTLYLSKTNAEAFTPTADFQPCTKKYVDDITGNIASILASI